MITIDQTGCQAKRIAHALMPRVQIVDPEENKEGWATGLFCRLAARDCLTKFADFSRHGRRP
jgi:hypothetical protein